MKKLIKSIALLSFVAVTLISCGGTKQQATNNESDVVDIVEPCKGAEFRSDKDYYRGFGSAESPDKNIAREKALLIAKNALAGNIGTDIKSFNRKYVGELDIKKYNSSSSDKSINVNDIEQKYNNYATGIVSQSLNGVTVICEKMQKSKSTGLFSSYYSIEVSKKVIIDDYVDAISKDKVLQVDKNIQNFKKEMQEAIK